MKHDPKLLIELLRRDALKFGMLGTFPLASGGTSRYYVDARTVTLSAEGAALVGAGVLHHIADLPATQAIGGLTMGADPIIGAALAMAGSGVLPGLKGFLVRKESKAHGTRRLVEGPLTEGMKVVVVEDVATTGQSALRAVNAVEEIGCQVLRVVALLDRLEGAAEEFAHRGLDFRAITTINDLIGV